MNDRKERKLVLDALAEARDAIQETREDLRRGMHTSTMCLSCHHGPAASVTVLHCAECHVDTFAHGRFSVLTCRACDVVGQAATYRIETGG